ncbi:unnamed protein product, partial [Discosporangium mesarthrocarpum]
GQVLVDGNCVGCSPDSMECDRPGLNISVLPIKGGYWRSSIDTLDVFSCPNVAACQGGVGIGDFCKEGYEGVLCGVCEPGYSKSVGYVCTPCSQYHR